MNSQDIFRTGNTQTINSFFDIPLSQDKAIGFSNVPVTRQNEDLYPEYSFIKRVADITGAVLGILLSLPLWIFIAILIKMTSKGPVFFIQTRAGQNGKPFKMYKFRSMVVDAEDRLNELIDIDNLEEPVFKIKNDPRVTLAGRFLRRTSLDELPQVINVLKGEMSLVGPRPEEVRIVEKYSAYQRLRLKAKPGISGYQQIMNRGEASFSKRLEYDLVYLEKQNVIMDLHILFMTVFVVFSGKGTH